LYSDGGKRNIRGRDRERSPTIHGDSPHAVTLA